MKNKLFMQIYMNPSYNFNIRNRTIKKIYY